MPQPTRYINAGPMPAQANPAVMMAPGKALENLGHSIEQTGEMGMELVARARKVAEGGAISAFMADAQSQAAEFANSLATRHDTDAWPQEWKNKAAEFHQRGKSLGLSPEGLARLNEEILNFTTQQGIRLETQGLSKKLGIARAQTRQSLEFQMSRGEKEDFDRTLAIAEDTGIYDPAEISHAKRTFSVMESATGLKQMLESDPQGMLDLPDEHFLNVLPGISLEQIERGRSAARDKIQEFRSGEMDKLEVALNAGTIHQRDIEAARFITDKDRASLIDALGQKDPPSNENHGKAWGLLGTLREARQDPSITPDQYRKLFNETRGSVLRRIAPRWQGDIRQELSYLSPAGRAKDPAKIATAYERGDLEAQGRDVAFRARDAGLFGSVTDEATPAEREKAYRRAEDIRLQVKRYVAGKPQATPEEVRDFADAQISGDRVKTTVSELSPFIPGSAQRLRPPPAMPQLPPKSGAKDKANPDPLQIPAGPGAASDALLPSKQLDTFLDQ